MPTAAALPHEVPEVFLTDGGIETEIMFGTDYPFPLGEQEPGKGIAALGLDEAAQARIYHGTALEWLGLSKARFE